MRGSRIKASCERGSIMVSYPDELSGDACHIYAADQLCRKFIAEDVKRYGSDAGRSVWAMPRICGGIPSGECVHVFVLQSEVHELAKTEARERMEVA